MLQRLFHVNVCVRDMERSIRFYQDLGFNKVNDFTLDDPSVGMRLGLRQRNCAVYSCAWEMMPMRRCLISCNSSIHRPKDNRIRP